MAEAKRKTKKKAGKKEEAAEAPPPEMPDIDAPAKKGCAKMGRYVLRPHVALDVFLHHAA